MAAKSYYEVLGVKQNVTLPQIEEAYRSLKKRAEEDRSVDIRQVEIAYNTLRDPNLKRKYNVDLEEGKLSETREEKPPVEQPVVPDEVPPLLRPGSEAKRPSIRVIAIFVICSLLLGLAIGLLWTYSYVFKDFGPGTRLENSRTGTFLGTVVAVEDRHIFPNGTVGPAYEVRLESDGSRTWFSRIEINKLYRRAG
jgi:curved DNA-binding protein CbpA